MSEKKILLIEDNPDDIELTLHAMRENKIANEVIVRNDGAAGLEYLLDATNEMPTIILLDLKLPKLGGIEVLKAIRENPRTKLVPVVILTSSREEADIVESYRGGANSYIVKPVDFDGFTGAVRDLGLYWLLLNEPSPKSGDRSTTLGPTSPVTV